MTTNNTEKPQKMGVTKRQKEYLDWIKTYISQNDGEAPSYEQISEAMGNTGVSSVHRIVQAIIARGHLVNIKGATRSLAVVE